jgi:hypothetical protein
VLKKSPQQLTPAALESALHEFIRAHEAIFDQWFRQIEAHQRARFDQLDTESRRGHEREMVHD